MENLKLIAAIGDLYELGYKNQLLWKISEDLDFYKRMTMGKYVIVGRNTFESMPAGAFKGRTPLVLTREKMDAYADVNCYDNIYDILDFVYRSDNEFMVIGGGKIYDLFLPYVDTMYLTEIMNNKKADKFFPPFDFNDWDVQLLKDASDEKIPYMRSKYIRKKVK